jgi:ferric-dicitrate binding protein FerR (iron transport regulator)
MVDGVAVPSTKNLNGWPVVAGQQISSGTENAVLALVDGNRVTLKPNTTARLLSTEADTILQLTQGELSLDIKNPAAFRLKVAERVVTSDGAMQSDVKLRPDNTVVIAKRTGRVLVDGNEPKPVPAPAPQAGSGSGGGGGVPGWVYVVIVAGAAGGVAAGLALTGDDEDSVSPSTP